MNTLFIHPFFPQKSLFKAYDIRGDVTLFTDDFVWSLARVFAELFVYAHQTAATTPTLAANKPTVVIGYDARHQSQEIAKYMAYACQQAGLVVQWLGLTTTPMMAFMAQQFSGNGLIVTASHSQKHINGIKWLINHESPSGDDVQQLYEALIGYKAIVPDDRLIAAIRQTTYSTPKDLFATYIQAIEQAFAHINQAKRTQTTYFHAPQQIVIDCMHGATSDFAEALFSQLGYCCIMLNASPDGNFPQGNPDPTQSNRLTQLAHTVKATGSDIGLAFDGDGDRVMVIDAQGQMISPDNLLYLLSRIAIEELPSTHTSTAKKVIFDVKCSHHVPSLIASHGATPMMTKTGSSLMRKSLQNKSDNAIFAGELSGHFIFNDGYFVLHDDAMYAAARLLNWLSHQPISLNDILASLPTCISTADMYLPIADNHYGQTVIARITALGKKPFKRLKSSFAVKNVNTIDGLRLDFAEGFGILRKSNTGSFLTVRFSANDVAELRHIQSIFVDLCRTIDDNLAEQVAQIQPV